MVVGSVVSLAAMDGMSADSGAHQALAVGAS